MTERQPHTESELIELLRASDVRAPDSLHRQVQGLVTAHGRRRRASPRPVFGAIAVAAIVAVALAVVLVGGGGGAHAHTPSLGQAAAPTLRAATQPAPAENSANHAQLAAAVDGVRFPYWGERFGWHSTGTRSDLVDGRMVTTVFYADAAGRRIGYAILAGTPAPRIQGGTVIWRGGVPYRLLTVNGAALVTWLRDGHLCVVSGRGVSGATLLRLASWSDRQVERS